MYFYFSYFYESTFYLMIKICLNLFILIAIPFSIKGQLTPAYSKYYSYQDGLPDRTVYDIIKDSNGMMWLSTNSGLARFDGKQIKTFSNQQITNLAQKINIKGAGKISEDNFQNLVIQSYSTDDSLEIFNINNLESYGISLNNLPNVEGVFIDLCKLKNGDIYILNRVSNFLYVYQWQGNKDFKFIYKLKSTSGKGEKNDRLAVSQDGTIWIFDYFNQQIFKKRKGQEEEKFPILNQNKTEENRLDFFQTTQIGNLIYSISESYNITLIDGKDNAIENFPTKNQFNQFWEDNHSNVIISSTKLGISNKLFFISSEREIIDLENIRNIEAKITSIYGEDFTKSFHLGSHNGFYVFEFSSKKDKINNYLDRELEGGRFGKIMRGFAEDHLNNVYASEEGKNWFRLNNETNKFDTLQLRDENGNLLENVSCGGNLHFDGKYVWGVSCNKEQPGRIHRYHPESKKWKVWYLPENAVFPRIILPKSENEFWVFTLHRINRDGSIFIFNKDTGQFITFSDWSGTTAPLKKRGVNYVLEDENKILWIATSKGLLKFNPNKKTIEEFFLNKYNNDFATLHLDQNGTLWVGTNGLGLFTFDRIQGEFSPFNLLNDENNLFESNTIPILPNNYIAGISPINENEYLVSTWRGLALLNIKEKSSIHYFKKDGLSSDEFNRLSIFKDKKNNIFLGGVNGFDVFKLEDLQEKKTHPKPRITRFFVYDETEDKIKNQYHQLDFSSALTIPSNSPFFGFDLMLPNYLESENNTFQTWLENYEYGFNLPTKSPTIQYNRIPPGDYILHIKASDSRGNTSVEELTLNIHVLPVFYKTWWFLTLATFGLLGIVVWYFRRRIKAIRKTQKEEKERRENQRKFLELELKTLRLQLNPHFMFNALGAIQYYIKKNDTRLAINYLADFAKLMRLFLESSKKRYIVLEEEMELIRLYVDLERMRFDNKFDVEYKIDKSLDLSITEIPSLLLQPFIENAINHGLRHKINKGNLLIQIINDEQNEMIHCIIEDDGIGRRRAAIVKNQSIRKYKSRGTQIVQERLEAFKVSGELDLEIKTEDADPTLEDCGTRVTVSIPNVE